MNPFTVSRTLSERRLPPAALRRGATLLELLVVVLIMLMITAATIPVLSPSVSGRRIREAARMVTTFINAARARAMETGRPAGVWIERMPGLPEAANTLHFAEVPPVYAGDYLDSVITASLIDYSGNQIPPGSWSSQNFGMQDYWNIVEPRSGSSLGAVTMYDSWSHRVSGATSITETTAQIVHVGDRIRFEGTDYLYTLGTAKLGDGNLHWYIMQGKNTAAGDLKSLGLPPPYFGAPYSNVRNPWGGFQIKWFEPDGDASGTWGVRTTRPRRYQVFRRPTRLQAGSIELPQGTVIDLNFSSLTDGSYDDVGDSLYPRNGVSTDTKGVNRANQYIGPPFNPTDETPIILVFAPNGQVEQFWSQRADMSTKTSSFERIEPFGSLYLLIGQQELINPAEYDFSAKTQLNKNWTHPDSLWVRLNTLHGGVTTAVVNPAFNTVPNDTQRLDPGITGTGTTIGGFTLTVTRSGAAGHSGALNNFNIGGQ